MKSFMVLVFSVYSFHTSLHNSFEKLLKKGMMPTTMFKNGDLIFFNKGAVLCQHLLTEL